MTGGGFGGCTINLVDAADTAEFERQIANGYFCSDWNSSGDLRVRSLGRRRSGFTGVTAWRDESTEIMTARELQESAHRRLNPLTREWVLVSPHRTQRPWRGKVEAVPAASALAYDPSCYLCPGNERSGGKRNPQYKDTFVFENDFPALLRDAPEFIARRFRVAGGSFGGRRVPGGLLFSATRFDDGANDSGGIAAGGGRVGG